MPKGPLIEDPDKRTLVIAIAMGLLLAIALGLAYVITSATLGF